MSMFRSVNMIHKNISIPRDNAVEFMDQLGRNTEGVEFIDLHKGELEGKKNYYEKVKVCDEIDKKLSNIEKVCERYRKVIIKYTDYKTFFEDLDNEERMKRNERKDFFDYVRSEVTKDDEKLSELINSYDTISESLEYVKDKKAVYDKISQLILSGAGDILDYSKGRVSSIDDEAYFGLNTLCGVIRADDEIKMKRMLLRVSRGRATPSFFELLRNNKSQKRIFTIFFPAGNENILMQKLIQVCDIYGASRFSLPKSEQMRSEVIALQSEIEEKEKYLKQAKTLIDDFLRDKIGNTFDNKQGKYDLYRQYIIKQKYIYTTLNKCELTDNFVKGQIWVTEENYNNVKREIDNLSESLSMSATFSEGDPDKIKKLTPPTHIKTNELTWIYQEITDAYGVPRYGEINPSLYAIVTFPFLFGVMFGDIGHGGLLLLFSLYLIFWADDIKKSDSPLKFALKVRYLFLLMGISAFYMGWMYNDFLSIPINLFGSCYKNVNFLFRI